MRSESGFDQGERLRLQRGGCGGYRCQGPQVRHELPGQRARLVRLQVHRGHRRARHRQLEVPLIDLVETELMPLLAAQPDIGRPATLQLLHDAAESAWLTRLAPLSARRRLRPREWLLAGFWVPCCRSSDVIYLASARHEREAQYR